jgi:RNA polymerase sigma-70 factor (ECF subfamily)
METGHALAAATRPLAVFSTTPDELLIKAIAAGDRSAIRGLYARHHAKVYRFILRMVGNEATAEDLLAEVFFDAWRQADRFEGRSQVSTWLLAIARNKALSAMRARRVDQLDDIYAESIEDEADDPEVALDRKTTSALVQQCLARLSPAHREVIDLVYYHEKTMQEIADIVGIPVGTVKTRMFCARKQLAVLLANAGIDIPAEVRPSPGRATSAHVIPARVRNSRPRIVVRARA